MDSSDLDGIENQIEHLANMTARVAKAITGIDLMERAESEDIPGSLTEGVIGVTNAIMDVARAINNLAEAVRETN